MQTKLSVYCDRLIEAGWLAAAAVIPFFFNVYSSRVFEPDKLTLLRSIALIMAAAFIIKSIDSLPSNLSLTSWLRRVATATPLSIPVLIFVALYILTTLTSVAPSISFWGSYQRLQGTLVNLSYITVFFLTAHHMRTKTQLSRLIWVVVLDASAISLYGLIQHFRLDPLPWGGDVTMRVTSSMGNAIFLAAYLIMAVPLTIALLISNLTTLASTIQPTKDLRNNGSPPSGLDLIHPYIAIVVGLSFFGFVLKAIQYISFGRGLTEFALSDSLVLILGALLSSVGLALIVMKPQAFLAIRLRPLNFFLSSALCAMLLVQLVAILFSQSRGPWIGLAIGLVVFLFLALLRNRLYAIAIVATVFIALVVGFVVLLNKSDSPIAYLRTASPYLERIGSISDMDSGTSRVRLLIWFGDDIGKGAVGLITSDPVRTIIGYGPESMYVAYNKFYPPALANLEARNASPDRSHNDILDYLVTMGVLGLLSYLAVVATFFYVAAKYLWRSNDRYFQLAVIAFMAAIAGHLGETFFGIAIAATRTHFWLYLAATSALLLMSKAQKVTANVVVEAAVARPVAVAARVRGANPGITQSAARSQRARARRANVSTSPVAVATARTSAGWMSFLPLLCYLAVTAVAVPTLLLTNMVQQAEPPAYVIGGFLWLAFGIFLTAEWVKRDERPSVVWRSTRWWLYGGVVVLSAYVILQFFLSAVIADIHFKKAQAYENVRRFDYSVREYLTALNWAPTQDFYYLFLGRAYLEVAKSAPDQKSSLQIKSVNDLPRLDERRIVPLSRDDLFNSSLYALTMAKQLNPLNTDNSANLGRLYRIWAEATTDPAKRNERLEIALGYYEDTLALSPNAAHLYDEWGLVYYEQGKPDEAIEKYEKALALDKKYVNTYLYLGEIYLSKNQLDKAEELYREATKVYPSMANAHISLGYIYHQQGKIQESLAENIKAAELVPNDFQTRRNLAVIYQELGMLDKAIAEAQVALTLAPQDQKAAVQSLIVDLQRRRSGG